MGISSTGIGSNLDVEGIISKLMAVEAQPLTTLDNKTKAVQAKISALGAISGAVGAFQGSLSSLSSLSSFQSLSSLSSNTDVMVGSATNKATPGTYRINVTQVAQSQSLATAGRSSSTAAIGLGAATTLSFSFGTVSGGSFGLAGGALGAGVLTGGISNGALSINGTAIATDASTRSAKALADAINAKNSSTGVTATAQPTVTSAALFATYGDIDTSGGGTYSLSVGGVNIASQLSGVAGGAGITAASLDAALAAGTGVNDALAAIGVTVSGTAVGGNLQFTNGDGSNITIAEAVTGSVLGGIGKSAVTANTGSTQTASATVSLASDSASPITIGGSNPAVAGFTAGIGGSYSGASFAQAASQISGTVVIDSTNNSLAGIRDAINKASVGVTASIVSDGSANPNRLVLTSTKTGESSTLKISVSGDGVNPADADIAALLGYDPAGVQNLQQNAAARSTKLEVNGIGVSSDSTTVASAIEGISLTIGKVGQANLVVSQDTNAVKTSVTAFVKAYNDLNAAIAKVTGYDPSTKTGGALLGDSTVQTLQTQLRKQLTTGITGLTGSLSNLSQVGVSFQKDGSLSLDSGKLSTATSKNFSDIAGLFAAVGKVSDTLVNFTSSTSNTVPGSYALNITALASQGKIVSDAALPPTTTIAAGTKWTVTLNQTDPVDADRTQVVALDAGTYTSAQLATLIQSAINGVSKFSSNDLAVAATVGDDGRLTLASAKYGSVSKIAISSNTGSDPAAIFGAAVPTDGVDVAGTIGGQPAKGSGQFLTGADGAPSAGLKIEVTGGAVGERGTVGFSQGYAYQLNNLASTFLGAKGLITSRTDGLNKTVTDIAKQHDTISERLIDIEKRYRAQYTALDTALSSLTATQNFLTQQFAALSKSTS